MPGYLVARVDWHDEEAPKRYLMMVLESLRPFGGKYLARGKPYETLEGQQAPPRLAILEFPTPDAARQWHESADYAAARKVRETHATSHWLVVMDGIEGTS